MSLKVWWSLTPTSRPSMSQVAKQLGLSSGGAKKILQGQRRVDDQQELAGELLSLDQPAKAKEYLSALARGESAEVLEQIKLTIVKENSEEQKCQPPALGSPRNTPMQLHPSQMDVGDAVLLFLRRHVEDELGIVPKWDRSPDRHPASPSQYALWQPSMELTAKGVTGNPPLYKFRLWFYCDGGNCGLLSNLAYIRNSFASDSQPHELLQVLENGLFSMTIAEEKQRCPGGDHWGDVGFARIDLRLAVGSKGVGSK